MDQRALWLARNILPHEPALRAWLQRRLVPGIDIDDIVQETYERLGSSESVTQIRDPKRYAFQVAHSIIATYVRRSRVVSIQVMASLEAIKATSNEPDPEMQVADRDELNRLALAIADLPVKAREVFVLRRVQGLPQREVAMRLGLSESTVEKHMSKSFRHLAALLGRGGKGRGRASKGEQEETAPLDVKTNEPRD